MEKNYSSKHAKNIAQTDHRISQTERENLNNIHPKKRTKSKKKATYSELPIRQKTIPKMAIPTKWGHFHQGKFQKNLPSCQ